MKNKKVAFIVILTLVITMAYSVYAASYCPDCGEYSLHVSTKSATCSELGHKKYSCGNCGYNKKFDIKKKPHSFYGGSCTRSSKCMVCEVSGEKKPHTFTYCILEDDAGNGIDNYWKCSGCGLIRR